MQPTMASRSGEGACSSLLTGWLARSHGRRSLGSTKAAHSHEFFIPDGQVSRWAYLKGPKREERTAANGHQYFYSEGGIAFPDRTDVPSRTVLTGEGGTSPSRFKHVVRTKDGRLRRLTPVELERLNGFEDGWTEGMPDGRRAFMMGNALVVGLVTKVESTLLVVPQRGAREDIRA